MIRTLCKIYQIKTPKCSRKFTNTIKLTLSFLYINKQNMLQNHFGTTKTLWLYMSLLYSLNTSYWRVEKSFILSLTDYLVASQTFPSLYILWSLKVKLLSTVKSFKGLGTFHLQMNISVIL